jgi:hypothetical protein
VAQEKRRSQRIDVRDRLQARVVTLGVHAVVRDISLGGFSLESDEPLPGGVHVVRLHEGERWSVTVTAASRHNGHTVANNGDTRHIMGFEYEDQSIDTQQTIRVLYERLAADQPPAD